MVSCFGLAAAEVTLVLAHLARQSFDHTFLGKDGVFLIINALLDTLSVTADLEVKVIFPLVLPLSQTIEILDLD